VLTRLCHTQATVVFPKLADEKQAAVLRSQLERSGVCERHRVVWQDGEAAIALLQRWSVPLESMGRRYADDPALFLAPAAAGMWAMQNG
jgi:hypothetical protein